MTAENKRNFLRAFWDFFVLFSGISTASNLSRTQPRPVRTRGLFLFRPKAFVVSPQEREKQESRATNSL